MLDQLLKLPEYTLPMHREKQIVCWINTPSGKSMIQDNIIRLCKMHIFNS